MSTYVSDKDLREVILGNESKLIVKKAVDFWINRHKELKEEVTIEIFTDIEFKPQELWKKQADAGSY